MMLIKTYIYASELKVCYAEPFRSIEFGLNLVLVDGSCVLNVRVVEI